MSASSGEAKDMVQKDKEPDFSYIIDEREYVPEPYDGVPDTIAADITDSDALQRTAEGIRELADRDPAETEDLVAKVTELQVARWQRIQQRREQAAEQPRHPRGRGGVSRLLGRASVLSLWTS